MEKIESIINKMPEDQDLLSALESLKAHLPLLEKIICSHANPTNKFLSKHDTLIKKLLKPINSVEFNELSKKIELMISHIKSE
jgi:hypothetical protein